jgi:hypothetical protein
VTLGRDGRAPDGGSGRPAAGRDDRRVGSTAKGWENAQAPWGGPEIEELPAQPVLAPGRGRPGLTTAAAAGVLVVILAAGFGVLGGRRSPSPTSPALAAASATTSLAAPSVAEPLVTPAVPCLPLARALPEIRLMVAGRGGAGALNVYEWIQPGPQQTQGIVLRDLAPGRTELRSDVLAELQTVGDACASAWTIDLGGPDDAIRLEDIESAPGDPASARQNRFALDLARYRGHDYDLHANLTFPEVMLQTTWPIRILPFDPPSAQLTMSDQKVDVEPGCDLQLVLGTGYTELVNPCYADLRRLPKVASIARPSGPLVFRFPEGWYVVGASVTCGLIAEERFQPDPSCEIGWDDQGASLSIFGPSQGTWTLAIYGCATQPLTDVTNQACGTWYATIDARRSPG